MWPTYIDAVVTRLTNTPRPEHQLAAIPALTDETTFAPRSEADPESALATKYRTDAWITSDQVVALEEVR
ncbi:hypothetical protein [Haloarchaeobius sp. HRN-SO-5]|uniref:hypothetical protein n=1 Tax=Haloarchaeobius sp. HRN-SO-5 TaxID=3446118 RepID=UPI003EBF6726